MRLLLDTRLLLWATGWSSDTAGDPMPRVAAAMIDDMENELMFSPASIWEVAIKGGQKRASFSVDPRLLRRALLDNDSRELAITGEHAAAVANLSALHKDPFDRLLIAQATVEGVVLLTADRIIAQYPGPIRLV